MTRIFAMNGRVRTSVKTQYHDEIGNCKKQGAYVYGAYCVHGSTP